MERQKEKWLVFDNHSLTRIVTEMSGDEVLIFMKVFMLFDTHNLEGLRLDSDILDKTFEGKHKELPVRESLEKFKEMGLLIETDNGMTKMNPEYFSFTYE